MVITEGENVVVVVVNLEAVPVNTLQGGVTSLKITTEWGITVRRIRIFSRRAVITPTVIVEAVIKVESKGREDQGGGKTGSEDKLHGRKG